MKTKTIFLVASLTINVALIILSSFLYISNILNGTPEIKNGRLGQLKEDIVVGRLDGTDKIFSLPKGLIVRDASAMGMDWFEPYRFKLIITSDREDMVDYSIEQSPTPGEHGEFYSADIRSN